MMSSLVMSLGDMVCISRKNGAGPGRWVGALEWCKQNDCAWDWPLNPLIGVE